MADDLALAAQLQDEEDQAAEEELIQNAIERQREMNASHAQNIGNVIGNQVEYSELQ